MEIAKIKPTNYVYNKKQLIGKGSFGQVYLGYNQKQHFPVAVKIVSFEKISALMNKQTLLTKLKQEIVNMQIAKNQNLVQLLDAQVSSRNLYIICEYCNGQSFDAFLKRKGFLTENQALGFFKQILRGFQNLHSKKIVHRDLKPANLLMHNFNIKIADLGFSKAIDQHEQLLQSIVGTPLYMSPQIFNRDKYTQKTDIWSLGVILYQMLYGRIPWKAKSLMQLKQKVQNQSVQFPIVPFVTVHTKHLIQSMLQLQQKKRVGWQQLFSDYVLSSSTSSHQSLGMNGNEMIQQKNQQELESFKKLFQYIQNSSYIQSQNQLIRILIELRIKTKQQIDMDNRYEKAEQFFSYKIFLDQKKMEILSYCFYFFGRRNRISYLIKVFQYIHQIVKKIQSKQLTEFQPESYANLIAAQFLILKFAIHSLHKMLNRNIDTEQQRRIGDIVQNGPCHYPKYIGYLLKNDFESFEQFYSIFMTDYFQKKMNTLAYENQTLFNQFQKQLGGLYTNQIGDYKFVKFMLMNSMRSVFNNLKNIPHQNDQILMLGRMLYQFQKDQHIFELGDLLESHKSQNSQLRKNIHDLHKKLNEWRYDSNWKQKFCSLPQLKIENLNSFIKKQFKWNPLHVYASDVLK